jgi:hypothetical protein
LQNDFPDQWNLYLLGLKDFQEVDQLDPLSYYQIAGKSFCRILPRLRGVERNMWLTSTHKGFMVFPTGLGMAWKEIK